jgi:hypothetical protein
VRIHADAQRPERVHRGRQPPAERPVMHGHDRISEP